MDIDIEVKGLIELQRKTEAMIADLHGAPILNAMRDSVLQIDRDAKKNAPVSDGILRASILPGVRMSGSEVEGVVGTDLNYAPYMEFGTRPHWPPIAALERWAYKHHTSAFLVARAIARHGTKPRRFMQQAFETNEDNIIRRFERALEEVVNG